MGILQHLKIYPTDEKGIRHEFEVNDRLLHGVHSVNVDYEAGLIPEATITLYSTADIDELMDVKFNFEPQNIRDCIKYLSLTLQLDDTLNAAFIATIRSALTDLDSLADGGAMVDNEQKAKFILDRLME